MTDENRDEQGRFAQGNKPVAGFDRHPENRKPFKGRRNAYSCAAQRYMDMTDAEIRAELECADSGELTQAEQIALADIARLKNPADPQRLAILRNLLDRTEGRPVTADKEIEPYEPPIIELHFG